MVCCWSLRDSVIHCGDAQSKLQSTCSGCVFVSIADSSLPVSHLVHFHSTNRAQKWVEHFTFDSQNLKFHSLDVLTNLLEWKYLKIVTNLSYGIYLVQFAVFHYNVGITRSSSQYTLYGSLVRMIFKRALSFQFKFLFQFNLNELGVVLAASAALTLFFDYPFANLKKLIFDSKHGQTKHKSNQKTSNSQDGIKVE